MKKIVNYILILLLLIPIKVNAEGISNYFIDAEILNNGDLKVKELFILDGEYNGFERIINSVSGNNSIYDPEGFEITTVKTLSINNAEFDSINKEGHNYNKVSYANKGQYGVYTINNTGVGYSIKIYNPDVKNENGFYVEYILKSFAIKHEDVAELGWNIFSDELNEYIDNLELKLHLPGNKNELRAWGHGPLNGVTENIGKNIVSLKIENLNANTPIDLRVVFDKEVINQSLKTSSASSLETIINEETIKANEANKIREDAIKHEERKENIGKAINILLVGYLIGLILIVYRIYNKYDKEHSASLKTGYFRDIPASYGPEVVNYLLKKNIDSKQLSQSLLNLIADKFITFEEGKNKKDVTLIRTDNNKRELTKAESNLMKWFFEDLGKDGTVHLKDIKQYAKKNYQSFLDNYNSWKNEAIMDSESYNFYESASKPKTLGIIYAITGIIVAILGINYYINIYIALLVFLFSIISIIYFIIFKKRTIYGNEEYHKWNGLKNFIKDFGNFKERELPQIHLWEKYLVYASVFGLAHKLSKSMEIKFQEIHGNSSQIGNTLFDIYLINSMMNINNTINNSVNGAVSSALSAKSIAESHTSSSGGFGGGFSGGGGSFGGGGGGGRF